MKYIINIFLFLLFATSCSTQQVVGKYRTNVATYGMFQKTLTIMCDSSFVLNFSGDFMDDNSYGSWRIKGDTLILIYDSINYPHSRYKGFSHYLIKRNKLTDHFPISKAKYEELKSWIENEGFADSVKIGSYSTYKRKTGKTLINFQGKMKRQYLKKTEQFKCEK